MDLAIVNFMFRLSSMWAWQVVKFVGHGLDRLSDLIVKYVGHGLGGLSNLHPYCQVCSRIITGEKLN